MYLTMKLKGVAVNITIILRTDHYIICFKMDENAMCEFIGLK